MNNNNCDKKTELLKVYSELAQSYSSAVAELARSIGKVSTRETEKLNLAAERARLKAIEARSELEVHMMEHKC